MKPVWYCLRRRLTRPQLKIIYTRLLPTIREVARQNGYAIGVHGSMSRDLDLIAAPWTKSALQPLTLAVRIHKAISRYSYTRSSFIKQGTGNKPHGRVAYVLTIGTHGVNTRHPKSIYIDLSIMPSR